VTEIAKQIIDEEAHNDIGHNGIGDEKVNHEQQREVGGGANNDGIEHTENKL
jgi:hypothetical protein